jgi:hypothetical protein
MAENASMGAYETAGWRGTDMDVGATLAYPSKRRRKAAVGILFLFYVICLLDRQIMSLLAPAI